MSYQANRYFYRDAVDYENGRTRKLPLLWAGRIEQPHQLSPLALLSIQRDGAIYDLQAAENRNAPKEEIDRLRNRAAQLHKQLHETP